MKTSLISIFLTAEAMSPILDKLLDAGMTLVILGIAVKVLWGKIKELESRLAKYIDEDRKEMIDTINNNTDAFKSLKEHLEKIKP